MTLNDLTTICKIALRNSPHDETDAIEAVKMVRLYVKAQRLMHASRRVESSKRLIELHSQRLAEAQKLLTELS